MTRKQTLKTIAELYNANTCNSYEETRCQAIVSGNMVIIRSIKESTCFYHSDVVAELANAFQLSHYIKYEDGFMKGIIF